MPTMWQRSYAYTRDHLTPGERERKKQQEHDELLQSREQRASGRAYRCLACGYITPDAFKSPEAPLYCLCGGQVEIRQIWAPCPRCRQEHNVSHLAERCNSLSRDPDEFLAIYAAKELCLDCQIANRRLPKAAKAQGVKVPLRIERV